MKRTLTVLTAAIFAGAMALPAFAQGIGAGVSAGAGDTGVNAGASASVNHNDSDKSTNPDYEKSEKTTNETMTERTGNGHKMVEKHHHYSTTTSKRSDNSEALEAGEDAGLGVSAGTHANTGD